MAGSTATKDPFDLEDRVAIITGGGTGIGRATALILAERGADVVVAGRRAEPLQSTAADVRSLGRRALAIPTDVTTADACDQLVEATMAEFGRVDIVVNNAGGATVQPLDAWSEDDWRYTVALNLDAVYFLSRAAARVMTSGKGAIVNISSMASTTPAAAAAYGAAKAGVNNLTQTMAAYWASKGIRVNCISCGAVRAAALTDELARYGIDPDSLGRGIGVGRIGEPAEIGMGILFFASDAASYCSGQVLTMNGGPANNGPM